MNQRLNWHSVGRNVAIAAALLFGLACPAVATELHNGLISYWPLDEGAGDLAADGFGAEFDQGELRFEPEWLNANDAMLGASALRFDGFEQDVLVNSSLDMDLGTNAVSISAWVNFDYLPSELVENFGGIFDSAQDSYVMYLDKGNQELRFKVTDADGTAERPGVPEALLTPETWNHVLGVYDGSEGVAKIYFNGELVDSHLNSDLTGLVRPGQLAGIGANPTGDPGNPSQYFFPGAIDDLAVWNRPLGRAEATYLYNSGLGTAVGAANPDIQPISDLPPIEPVAPTASPVIHYRFDGTLENSGTGGETYNLDFLDGGANENIFTDSDQGMALDLRENPVSQATDGDAVSVDYELTDAGTILFDYQVDEYYNYQSLWTNSVEPNDWEMWIYNDGIVRGRVEGDAYVSFDLDTLSGLGESYEIAFTWERDGDNVAVKLFVDGELRDQDLTGTWVIPGSTFFIGGGDGTNHFGNGVWDEFRIYAVALSEGEVLYLFQSGTGGVAGDFNGDGLLDAADLADLDAALGGGNLAFDLNSDGTVDTNDRNFWVKDLANSWIGDSNLDGEFNSSDFVQVFTSGKYETGQAAAWSEGDWNGDLVFDSSDFVEAFQDGGYELGPRTGTQAVPEPNGFVSSCLCLFAIGWFLRRRRS
ncbi:MAG: LamG domain-containing protein [Pirellulaceae bacterium]